MTEVSKPGPQPENAPDPGADAPTPDHWRVQTLNTPAGRTLARRRSPPTPGRATLVWFSGFGSDMDGGKAQAMHALADATGRGCERFDYSGHGVSSGRFEDGVVSDWLDDSLAVIDDCGPGPLVLIGSSMGAWLALLAALARPDRAAGLVLIAPAPDFTERLMWDQFDAAIRDTLTRDGVWMRPSAYDPQGQAVTLRLIEDGRAHLLMDAPSIPVTAPVRIVHGDQDESVPWRHGLALVDLLDSQDVTFTLVKGGDHRLSEPADMQRLEALVADLCAQVEAEASA